MDCEHPASSKSFASVKPPPKRSRKKAMSYQQYIPAGTSSNSQQLVSVFSVGSKGSSGRFGVKHSVIQVERTPKILPGPTQLQDEVQNMLLEDDNAQDAAEWHDMLEDEEINVTKRKRKQRNDSVSYEVACKRNPLTLLDCRRR